MKETEFPNALGAQTVRTVQENFHESNKNCDLCKCVCVSKQSFVCMSRYFVCLFVSVSLLLIFRYLWCLSDVHVG